MFPHIEKYNALWSGGHIDQPLVILIGGYAGTGKSTLAKRLLEQFTFSSIIQTAVLRSLLRTQRNRLKDPFLFAHTYDLASLDSSGTIPLHEKYRKQVEPIAAFVNELIDLAGTEKQQRIIEGAHVFPGLAIARASVICVEAYLKVSDAKRHELTIAGPTHNRRLSEGQFRAGRTLHDYIIEEAVALGKPVYELGEAYDKVMQAIETIVTPYVE